MNCFQPAPGPTCFVMLGKFGDLIHMLPVFLHTFKRDKVKPVVMVSDQFASVLDGVSYVTPWVVPMKWPDGIPAARAEAEKPKARVFDNLVFIHREVEMQQRHEAYGGLPKLPSMSQLMRRT